MKTNVLTGLQWSVLAVMVLDLLDTSVKYIDPSLKNSHTVSIYIHTLRPLALRANAFCGLGQSPPHFFSTTHIRLSPHLHLHS
jgi:hypothetical protein